MCSMTWTSTEKRLRNRNLRVKLFGLQCTSRGDVCVLACCKIVSQLLNKLSTPVHQTVHVIEQSYFIRSRLASCRTKDCTTTTVVSSV